MATVKRMIYIEIDIYGKRMIYRNRYHYCYIYIEIDIHVKRVIYINCIALAIDPFLAWAGQRGRGASEGQTYGRGHGPDPWQEGINSTGPRSDQ